MAQGWASQVRQSPGHVRTQPDTIVAVEVGTLESLDTEKLHRRSPYGVFTTADEGWVVKDSGYCQQRLSCR